MINALFLRLQLSNLLLLLSSSTHKQTSMASRANQFQIFLKNSELKTTHNTFRDCCVHFFGQPFSKQLYTQGSLDQIDCIAPLEIQDILGYWIPRRGFRIPATGFQSFLVEPWILDSNRQWDSGLLEMYSGFQSRGFQIPLANCSRILESGFPYMRRNTAFSSRSFEERQLHSKANCFVEAQE